jgi:hypothetical protein
MAGNETPTLAPAELRPGELLGRLLHGAWREDPPPRDMDEDAVRRALPLALPWSMAALLWHRWGNGPDGELLNAARHATLKNARSISAISEIHRRLPAVGLPYLHFKGHAAAANYARPELRHLGSDTDILVPPGKEAEARALMLVHPIYSVDAKHRFAARSRVPWADLLAHSRTVRIGDMEIPTLGPEHHLAAIAENMLHHGGRGPRALVDAAALIERHGATMRWELLARRPLRPWVTTVAGLAHAALGSRIDAVPFRRSELTPPGWALRALYSAWEEPQHAHATGPPLFLSVTRSPGAMAEAIHERWPPAITAVHELGLDGLPVIPQPAQLALFLGQRRGFAARLLLSLLRSRVGRE